jgi:uncharacterized OB-fold protein
VAASGEALVMAAEVAEVVDRDTSDHALGVVETDDAERVLFRIHGDASPRHRRAEQGKVERKNL